MCIEKRPCAHGRFPLYGGHLPCHIKLLIEIGTVELDVLHDHLRHAGEVHRPFLRYGIKGLVLRRKIIDFLIVE